ncbi:MAG: 4-alpha-glucanotransferase [Myxococcales bacterium]|nr:4-alpha-glucanotransferase [Myxococcales bacterium]MCB9737102.1 4-alpha-glucanotransferase [Deltaproteobacteria bacterium]
MNAALAGLAEAYGIETSYVNVLGDTVMAGDEALLRVLASLGAPVATLADVPDALRARREAWWRTLAPPCVVAWPGEAVQLALRLPAVATGAAEVAITLEDGTALAPDRIGDVAALPVLLAATLHGEDWAARVARIPDGLPVGYHRFAVTFAGRRSEGTLLVPPATVEPAGRALGDERAWGVFLPLYAVRKTHGAGVGDLGDLAALGRRVKALGGQLVGTLPLGPAFLDPAGPFEPSPYAPLSRRYWNELYVDLGAAPGFDACPEAQRVVEMPADIGGLVDYGDAWYRQRYALEALARRFFAAGGADDDAGFAAFQERCPDVWEYGRFRAKVDLTGRSWWEWPAEARGLGPENGSAVEERARAYVFGQYCADRDLARVAAATSLYLDLPLGVAPDGYETLRAPGAYALDMSLGAPPDRLFTGGQSWGLPPLRPEGLREGGYARLREMLGAQMRVASLVRVDHVMGLHRQLWVPAGMTAKDGVYVRMPADELWAVLCLESARRGCGVVGEDLGTVPPVVRQRMARHGALRMHVVQYEAFEEAGRPWREPEAGSIACLNTHDMPPFAAFAAGEDIDDRVALGLIDEAQAEEERAARRGIVAKLGEALGVGPDESLVAAALERLAASPAAVVLVNVEDLWGERRPQNVPGTWRERPNWRSRAAHGLATLEEDEAVRRVLEAVAARRAATPLAR